MIFTDRDPLAIKHFVREGFVIYRGLHSAYGAIEVRRNVIKARMADYRKRVSDVHEIAVRVVSEMEVTGLLRPITDCEKLVSVLQQYLGPDVCVLGYDALWINVPKDKNPVLSKNLHTDAWTGTGVNTIFVKTFFTDCDKYNGMTVCPGSHLQGLLPVRNRALDTKAKFKRLNLSMIKAGDVLMWHPLLIHSTTGHSPKNIRISMTSRYKSTETPFTSQERALGYRTLSVGPLNRILRLVGNDYLTPLRTHGGTVAIDKRMARIYEGEQ